MEHVGTAARRSAEKDNLQLSRSCWRHLERSRCSGGARDLPKQGPLHGRSLRALVRTRAFGMTPRIPVEVIDSLRMRGPLSSRLSASSPCSGFPKLQIMLPLHRWPPLSAAMECCVASLRRRFLRPCWSGAELSTMTRHNDFSSCCFSPSRARIDDRPARRSGSDRCCN